MAETIEIRDIRLTPLEHEQVTRAMSQSRLSWYSLTVTVRNTSDARPLYVMSDIRKIEYDAGRRALRLLLSEDDPGPERPDIASLPLPPGITTIAPGDEARMTFQLS